MAKRPTNVQTHPPLSEDLVDRLKAAGNDSHLLREIIESNDSVSVAAAFATLLSPSSDALSEAKRRKEVR